MKNEQAQEEQRSEGLAAATGSALSGDALVAYLQSLKPGERVKETDHSSCLRGREGTTYLNGSGCMCVLWDRNPGEKGPLGTSVTGGTRRVIEHTHEWHPVTRYPGGWQDVCVTCGEHRDVPNVRMSHSSPESERE